MRVLRKYLSSLTSGPIRDSKKLERLLAPVWEDFTATEGGMEGCKLHDRMEQVIWSPPDLTFSIERHGSLCQGSTRAEVQHWRISIEVTSAILEGTTHRQTKPMSPRLDACSKAKEIVAAVQDARQDVEFLKWTGEGMVRVLMVKLVPPDSGFKQTRQDRRKQLREELSKLMPLGGWSPVEKRDTFVRSSRHSS
jgi:hypothetical protein